ncbi:MAG: hypothetical protein ABI728_13360 [Betaproteobacteria bacterium]
MRTDELAPLVDMHAPELRAADHARLAQGSAQCGLHRRVINRARNDMLGMTIQLTGERT